MTFQFNLFQNVIQWWIIYPDTFVPGRYFRINKFSGLLNCPLVRTWKWVPTLFVWTSKISRLSELGLTNHHCNLFECYCVQQISSTSYLSTERTATSTGTAFLWAWTHCIIWHLTHDSATSSKTARWYRRTNTRFGYRRKISKWVL